MTYVVLARKYRPQQFADLVGQEAIARTLKNAVTLGRVHHGLLFSGTRGVGKTTAARILAKALNCEQGPTDRPCGVCDNCQEITAGQNVDVLEIDGASHTSVDDIRDLRETVRFVPAKSKHKIYIIDEVHMLSNSAFNALLKTLEEPPPGVIFIFATTEPHKIPDTIHSRCQRFDFKQVSEVQTSRHLRHICEQEKIILSDEALQIIARQAAGSLRDALSFLDQVVAFAQSPQSRISDDEVSSVLGLTDRSLLFDICQKLVEHDQEGVLHSLAKVFITGADIKHFLLDMLGRVRDMLVLKVGADKHLIPGTEEDCWQLNELAKMCDQAELERWFDVLTTSVITLPRLNSPRVYIDIQFLRMAQAVPRLPLSDILQRLQCLEQSIGKSLPSSLAQATVPKQAPAAPDHQPKEADQVSAQVVAANVAASGDAATWDRIVNHIKGQKPAIAAVLLQSSDRSFDETSVILSYPEGSFYRQRAQEADFQEIVSSAASQIVGRPMKVLVQCARGRSLAQPSNKVSRDLERETLQHPVIKQALSIFDATIEEIKSSE